LRIADVFKPFVSGRPVDGPPYFVIDVMRKGRKPGYVIAPASLIEESTIYRQQHRKAWCKRAERKARASEQERFFINTRGSAVKKNTYQKVICRVSRDCGFRATTHLLRATFACMMLARLEQLAKKGAPINPLLIVKILMGHEHIETTDRYLRAVAIDAPVLSDILDSLIDGGG
jgi:integrase